MTRTRARRLTRTTFHATALALTILGGILTGISHPGWGAIFLAAAVTLVFAGWLIGVPIPPQRPQSPPRPYEEWRTELEVARFRGQISEWEATQRSQQ